MEKNDNRMRWILNSEKLKTKDLNHHYFEYEIASECHISHLFNYQDEMFLCSLLNWEKDKKGLYHYALKIKFPSIEENYDYKKAIRKGYFFKDGIIGEVLSLMSIFFQCRFYLLASYTGDLSVKGIKSKQEYSLNYYACNPEIHPTIFNKKKDFSKGFFDFLELIKSLNFKLHQQFILACYHYAKALKEIGKDHEMVFIRLVSSIEALSKDFTLKKKDDILSRINFNEILKNGELSKKEKDELENTFKNRKSRMKFKRFIENYSNGFFKGGNYKAKHTHIFKKDLAKTIDSIYISRSKYLHAGEPMYLSQTFKGEYKWDTDPSLGMVIGRRRFPKSLKLPYTHWFEKLVRHCLLNYLDDNQI